MKQFEKAVLDGPSSKRRSRAKDGAGGSDGEDDDKGKGDDEGQDESEGETVVPLKKKVSSAVRLFNATSVLINATLFCR